jgi:CDP-diacylglycerol--serine O-phosphatidyltransferase
MNRVLNLFSIPNLLTGFNLLCGSVAIIAALSGRIDIAPYFVVLAAAFDFLDGFAARLLKKQSPLGKQLDSLADMVSFGLAPGIIMMVYLIFVVSYEPYSASEVFYSQVNNALNFWRSAMFYDVSNFFRGTTLWIPCLALLIPFLSLFRLAKFNIDTRQTDCFIGLPTPANALFFISFPLGMASIYGDLKSYEWLTAWVMDEQIICGFILLFSWMLVVEIPLFSLKFVSFGWAKNEVRYIFLLMCLILIPLFGVWSIAIIVFLYLIISLLVNLLQSRKKQNDEVQGGN